MTSVSDAVRRSGVTGRVAGLMLGVVLGLASVAGMAHADADAETRTLARELARRGAEAFEQGDFNTALDRFTRAEALFPAPSIKVMLARSLVGVGRLVEALDAYEATQRAALGEDAPSAYREAVNDAKREGEALRARMPHLTIHVAGERGALVGLRVLLDSKQVPDALLDVDRPVDPGRHRLSASAPGHASVTRLTNLHERDQEVIEMTLSPGSDSAVTAPAIEAPAPAPRSGESSSRAVWGWVAVGAGVSGLAVSAITGVLALDKKSSLDSQCRPGCPASAGADIDSFRTYRTVSYVSLAVGAASLGVGSYILLTGRSGSPRVAASIGPAAASIWGTF